MEQPAAQQIPIKLDDASFRGTYANGTIISHTPDEFLIDFVSIFQQKGILSARVIVSPGHAKRLLQVLQDNIAHYERQFGAIKEAALPNVHVN